jgi:hypothetical protein
MSNRLKIFVIGGSELIGRVVAARLAGEGHGILSAAATLFDPNCFRKVTIEVSEATASDWSPVPFGLLLSAGTDGNFVIGLLPPFAKKQRLERAPVSFNSRCCAALKSPNAARIRPVKR